MNTSMNYLMLQSITGANAERIAYIDFKLRFTGLIKRSDLFDEFGLSDASASKLITQYSELRPDNLEYDRSQKVNTIQTQTYNPLIQINMDVALEMLAQGFNKNKISNKNFLPYSKIGVIPNQTKIEHVATITRAMFNQEEINCAYLSANSEKHAPRPLIPLTLINDDKNWMFRAYDRSEKEKSPFKNFNFSRVAEIESNYEKTKFQEEYESISQDNKWNLSLPLILELHPNISSKEKRIIRRDFGMKPNENELIIMEKAAFIWILSKKWNIDTNEIISKDNYYKFILKNRSMLLDYI